MTVTAALAIAYVLDLLMGDPRWIPHPVRGIGRAIEKLERNLRKHLPGYIAETKPADNENSDSHENESIEEIKRVNLSDMVPSFLRKGKNLSARAQEKMAGIILTALIVSATFIIFFIISSTLLGISFHPIAQYIAFGLYVFLVSTTLAARELIKSGKAVIKELSRGSIEGSKAKLSMIVGRDTKDLQEAGILKATIESLAENASDGIIAPLFYFALGGLPLAMTYKAINTLDSMVGYKNKKYKHFGWAAARLDDIANYIPARITGLLIVGASFILNSARFMVTWTASKRENIKNKTISAILKPAISMSDRMSAPDFESSRNAFRIMLRDGKKHSSPNSGVPEAAIAGALGIKLGGPSIYGGKKINKPHIGSFAKRDKSDTRTMGSIYMEAALSSLKIIRITSFSGLLLALPVTWLL